MAGANIGRFLLRSKDLDATKSFYEKVFPSWTFNVDPSGDWAFIPPDDGGAGPGGLVWKSSEVFGWLPCVKVSDINATITAWKNNQGTVVEDATKIGDQGWYAIVKDPDGATIGLYQP